MAWTFTESFIIDQAVDEISTTQKFPLGTIVRAKDPTLGAGEFVYLKGVASTVVGSVVRYNTTSFQTALGITARNLPQPIAVAMAATVADRYGWYQISGIATARKASATSLAAGVAVGLLTTGTGLIVASASDREVHGAIVATAASNTSPVKTTVQVLLDRPRMQGRAPA